MLSYFNSQDNYLVLPFVFCFLFHLHCVFLSYPHHDQTNIWVSYDWPEKVKNKPRSWKVVGLFIYC